MVQLGRLGAPTRRIAPAPVQDELLTDEDFFREQENQRQLRSQQQINRINELIQSRRDNFRQAQAELNLLLEQPLPDNGDARRGLQQLINQRQSALDDLRIQTEREIDQLEQSKRFATGEFDSTQVATFGLDRARQIADLEKRKDEIRKNIKQDLSVVLGKELGGKRAQQIVSSGKITRQELDTLSKETLNKIGVSNTKARTLKSGTTVFQQGDDEKPLIIRVSDLPAQELTEADAKKIRLVGGQPRFLTRAEFAKIPPSSFTDEDRAFNEFQNTNVLFSPERQEFIESQSAQKSLILKQPSKSIFPSGTIFSNPEFKRGKNEQSFFGIAVQEGKKRLFPEEFVRSQRENELVNRANSLFPTLNKDIEDFNLKFGNSTELTPELFAIAQSEQLSLNQRIAEAQGIESELQSIKDQRASEDKPFIVDFLNKPLIPVRDELLNFNKTFSLSDVASGVLQVPEKVGKKVSESEISREIFLEGLGLRGRLKPEVEKKFVKKGTTIIGDTALFSLAQPIALTSLGISGTSKTFDPTRPLEERFGGVVELGGVGVGFGVKGFKAGKRFLEEPVEFRLEGTKTKFASNDLVVSLPTQEGFKDIAKFDLIGFKEPTRLVTQTRGQSLLNFVVGDELFKDVQVIDKGFVAISKSDPFVVKDGVIQGRAKIFSVKKGERFSPLIISELEGGIRPAGLSARNIRGLPTDLQLALQRIAESKAGRPVSIDNVSKILGKEATIDLGGVVGTATFKVTRKGISIIPRGKRISRGDLLSVAEELDIPKKDFFLELGSEAGVKIGKNIPKENIDIFETFTSFRDITKPRFRASPDQFSDIKGITFRLEIPSIEEEGVKVARPSGLAKQRRKETLQRLAEAKALAVSTLEPKPITLKQAKAKVLKARGLEQKTTGLSSVGALAQIGSLQEAPSKQISAVKEKLIIRERSNLGFANLGLERNLNKELSKSISKELSKELSKSLNKELTKELTRQTTKQTTKQLTKQTPKLTPKVINPLPPRLPPNPPRLKPKTRIRADIKLDTLDDFEKESFNVLLRRRKQFSTVGTDLPLGLAKKVGVESALRGLGVTFRLVKTGRKTKRQDINFRVPKALFTSPTLTSELNKPLTFVQRRKTIGVRGGRLLTRGERAEIKKSRKKSR